MVFHTYGQVTFHTPLLVLGEVVDGYKVTGLPRVTWLTFTRTGSQVRCDYDVNFCLGEPIFLSPGEEEHVMLEAFVDKYLSNWRDSINMQLSMYNSVVETLPSNKALQ